MKSVPHRILDPHRIPFPFTPIPLVIMDSWLKDLSGDEFKVFCYIIRKTFNFTKSEDIIPRSQIVKATGIPLGTVKKAISALVSKNLLTISGPKNKHRKYIVNFDKPRKIYRLPTEPITRP